MNRMTLIYFVLLFVGVAFLGFGYRFNVMGFMISGILWLLVVPFAVRSTVHPYVVKWGLISTFIGSVAGAGFGIYFGKDITPIIGLLGGGMIGGIGSFLLQGILFDSILHLVFDAIFPKISNVVFYAVFIMGFIWGAVSLKELVPKYFEEVGGGILIGGTLGAFVSILLALEVIKREKEYLNS